MPRRLFLAGLLVAFPAGAAAQGGHAGDTATTIVLLVRHAEKASETDADPGLSAAGQVRAEALAATLADAGVASVIVTQRRRTGATAAPLTALRRLVPDTVPLGGTVASHAASVAARIRERHLGHTVLVVGHSNTIPAIMAALGAPPMPDLCDDAYDGLFVLVLRNGVAGGLTRARFGATSPAGGEGCTGMTAR
jgi:broad specificity phosphatase PhoE